MGAIIAGRERSERAQGEFGDAIRCSGRRAEPIALVRLEGAFFSWTNVLVAGEKQAGKCAVVV